MPLPMPISRFLHNGPELRSPARTPSYGATGPPQLPESVARVLFIGRKQTRPKRATRMNQNDSVYSMQDTEYR